VRKRIERKQDRLLSFASLHTAKIERSLESYCPVCFSCFSGPGPEVPYRIYVDSGYVLSCMTALAPVCPLIGPFALLYFIILSPMLRWLMVFAYRPTFDSGGDKWPKLYHIVISSLLLGQVSRMRAMSNSRRMLWFYNACFIALLAISSNCPHDDLSSLWFFPSISQKVAHDDYLSPEREFD
jgi:hypothetical protein